MERQRIVVGQDVLSMDGCAINTPLPAINTDIISSYRLLPTILSSIVGQSRSTLMGSHATNVTTTASHPMSICAARAHSDASHLSSKQTPAVIFIITLRCCKM